MNITQVASIRAEVIRYLKQANDAKNLGFGSVSRIQAAMAIGYVRASFDLRAIDAVTLSTLIAEIQTVIDPIPIVSAESLDKYANV